MACMAFLKDDYRLFHLFLHRPQIEFCYAVLDLKIEHMSITVTYSFLLKLSLRCTEGWDCNLGFQGWNFFAVMVWGASWDPTGRYSIMEPSVSTFIGLLQLSEVGLAVKKGQKQGEKSIELFWPENA